MARLLISGNSAFQAL